MMGALKRSVMAGQWWRLKMSDQKKCQVCEKTEGPLMTMMGETKCMDCMRKQLTKENYNSQKEFNKAVNNLKKGK